LLILGYGRLFLGSTDGFGLYFFLDTCDWNIDFVNINEMFADGLLLYVWIIVLPVGFVRIIALILAFFFLFNNSFFPKCFFLLKRFFYFFLVFIGVTSFLSDCSRGFFPHVMNLLLNLLIQERVVSRRILRVNKSKAIVRQFLIDNVRVKSHSIGMLLRSESLLLAKRDCLLQFFLHFLGSSFAGIHR
jgi:hypothetical protein